MARRYVNRHQAWAIVSGDCDLRDTYATRDEANEALARCRRRWPSMRFRVAEVEWIEDEALILPDELTATERAPSVAPHKPQEAA